MIRCVRLWTGPDGASHVEIGRLDLSPGATPTWCRPTMAAAHVTVEETAGGGTLAWHTAPVRQLVVTLAGTLLFSTRDGEEFTLHPGDVLLAEDTVGHAAISGSSRAPIRGDGCTSCWRPPTEVPFVARLAQLSDGGAAARATGSVARDDVRLVDHHRVLGARQERVRGADDAEEQIAKRHLRDWPPTPPRARGSAR